MNDESPNWSINVSARPRIINIGQGKINQCDNATYEMGDVWCIHFYEYPGHVLVNGVAIRFHSGDVGISPPFAHLAYSFHSNRPIRHLFAHYQLPTSTPGTQAEEAAISSIHEKNPLTKKLRSSMREAVSLFPFNPLHAEVRLWNILLQLVDMDVGKGFHHKSPCPHPGVNRAVQYIELHLTEPLTVREVAMAVELSHNHLTRLFQAALQTTVVSYIRQRRVQRAHHLLVYSTIPIKAIAYQVGIPDLQLFNKTVRRELRASPRQIREERGGVSNYRKNPKNPQVTL